MLNNLLNLNNCQMFQLGAEELSLFPFFQYLGKWYEIEKLPASFERGKCIEANYAIRPDHTIQVLNVQT